ncbi:MAG: TOMM precursor leader peptide-binding protein [Nocardioides sp.]
MRPLLRPGTHVLDRGDGNLQVGLDPRHAVVLPGSPGLRALLTRLDGSETDPHDALTLLAAQELLVEERSLIPLLGGAPSPDDAAALARRVGDRAAAVQARRGAAHVDVRTFGPAPALDLAAALRGLLATSGVPAGHRAATGAPVVGVLLGVGEPERDLVDAWTRSGTPYALVRLTEGRAVVGPFVEPGRTACLRCLDAHHTDADPAWPLLVQQYARACARGRDDGTPEPVDPALATLAVAWAARDVVAFVDGERPSTWSTTLTLGPDLCELTSHSWLRHPECACSW